MAQQTKIVTTPPKCVAFTIGNGSRTKKRRRFVASTGSLTAECGTQRVQVWTVLCTRGRYRIEGRPERNKEERKKETGAEKIMIDLAGKGGRSAQDD